MSSNGSCGDSRGDLWSNWSQKWEGYRAVDYYADYSMIATKPFASMPEMTNFWLSDQGPIELRCMQSLPF
jgi:hypothetical protein